MTDFPCHTKPKDQWCDASGPGGFMGHTCIKVAQTDPSADAPVKVYFDTCSGVIAIYANGSRRILSSGEILFALGTLAQAKQDTDRLNFLDECNVRLNEEYGTNYSWHLILNQNVNRVMLGDMTVDLADMHANGLRSCRDAIDAEMVRVTSARGSRLPSTTRGGEA